MMWTPYVKYLIDSKDIMFTPNGLNIVNIPMPPHAGTIAMPWLEQVEASINMMRLHQLEESEGNPLGDYHIKFYKNDDPNPWVDTKANHAGDH